MPIPSPFPTLTEDMLLSFQERAQTKREFQRVQCIYLRQHGCTSKDISPVLSLSPVTVKRVWIDFRKRGEDALFDDRRGGRYNQNMTQKDEEQFIQPFLQKAEEGGVLTVGDVHRAYEKKLKRTVPSSTVYALLHRHGWRKICPRTKHPQGDPIAQAVFKASFSPPSSAR